MTDKLTDHLTRIYLGLAIPLLVMVAAVNLMGYRMLHSQAQEISAYGLERYSTQLSKGLQEIQTHLVAFCTSESDINNMQYLNSESERVLASKRVIDRMKSDVNLYYEIRAEFLYSAHLDSYLIAREGGISFEDSLQVNNMVASVCEAINAHSQELYAGQWQRFVQDDVAYMLYFYSSGDVYMGTFIEAADLMQVPHFAEIPLTVQLIKNGDIIDELNSNGGVDADSGTCQSFQIGNTGLTLSVYTRQTVLQDSLRTMFLLLALLPAIVALTLIFLYIFTSKKIAKPIKKIVSCMEQVGDGDLGVRIDTGEMLEELAVIGETFNKTLGKLETLQRKEQENIRQQQISRLRNLQLQINPHFLGNCFNMLNNASLCSDVEQVFALTTHLSRYFRSMAQMEEDYISLEDELSFTKDFLEIQKLRFYGQFEYAINAPEFSKKIPVPPSVIKSFAENSIQHSRIAGKNILIQIEVNLCEVGEEPLLEIVICDNGPGFDERVLRLLGTEESPYFDGRIHIGIVNIRKRLDILYGSRASLKLANNTAGGARVVICIPLNGRKEGR